MSNYRNLLNDDDVLLVNKTLATAIGLDASMVLRQVVYWINQNRKNSSKKHYIEGRWWCFNTYEQWQSENFPFLSISTIRRAFGLLESLGLVIGTAKHNNSAMMKNKWYTVDFFVYEAFMTLWEEMGKPSAASNKSSKAHDAFIETWKEKRTTAQFEQSTAQSEQMDGSNWTDELLNLNKAITETTTEDTTDIKESTPLPPANDTSGNTDTELEEMKKAVKRVCRQYDKDQVLAIAKTLLSRFKGKDVERNLRRPITIAELEQWGLDMDKRIDYKTGKPLTRPRNQGSVLSNVAAWLDEKDGLIQTGIPKQTIVYANNTSTLAQAELSEDDRAAALEALRAAKQKASA